MKFSISAKVILSVTCLVLACETGGENDEEIEVQDAALALHGISLVDVSDVHAISFTVTSCDDPMLSFTEINPLEDQPIPENIPELANNPLDEGSEHLFADYFKVVPPGCYDVTAVPLDENEAPSSMCFRARKDDVVVEEGQTTEVFLMVQCAGEDEGAVDVIAAINHEPELDDVVFDDSKFICGSVGEVCAEAHDVDNDPLDFELEVPSYCTVDELDGSEEESSDVARVCWEVSCRRRGEADLVVRVYDQIWRDEELIRIEDWLADEGYGNESHTQLEFHAYFDGVRYYPDRDEDGYGDPNAAPWLVCEGDNPPEGHVPNNDDCDDGDPAVFPGSVCDDGAFCTVNDTCTAGVCSGDQPRDCNAAGDQCNIGVCDEAVDQCIPQPANEGGACDDGQFCTVADQCSAGVCVGGPRDCSGADDQCNVGICDEAGEVCVPEPANQGDACDDGNACTLQDQCSDGACVGAPRTCSGHGSCSNGTCHCNTGWIGAECSEPDIRNYTVTYTLSDVGVWPLVSGDCDMDTDGGDVVNTLASLSLSYSGSSVNLAVHFETAEYGGDHTAFNGTRNHSFSIPGPVVGFVGGTTCNLTGQTIGKNHLWNTFPGSCAFAPGLQYRIDSDGDDCDIVGVRGTVQFTVRYHRI